jgi:hypothetical protein
LTIELLKVKILVWMLKTSANKAAGEQKPAEA